MKLNAASENFVDVTLSKRNLLALLHKLEDSTSPRAIQRFDDGRWVIVRSEPDEAHYEGREPGRMSDETERYIGRFDRWERIGGMVEERDSGVLDERAPSWVKDKEVRIA